MHRGGAEGKGILASRVLGLGFELETQDAGLGTENYLSTISVPLCEYLLTRNPTNGAISEG